MMPVACSFPYIKLASISSNGCVESVKRRSKLPIPEPQQHLRLFAMPYGSGDGGTSLIQIDHGLRMKATIMPSLAE